MDCTGDSLNKYAVCGVLWNNYTGYGNCAEVICQAQSAGLGSIVVTAGKIAFQIEKRLDITYVTDIGGGKHDLGLSRRRTERVLATRQNYGD